MLGIRTYDQVVMGLTPGQVAVKWMGDCRQTDKQSRYITNHTGQLSLPSLQGR